MPVLRFFRKLRCRCYGFGNFRKNRNTGTLDLELRVPPLVVVAVSAFAIWLLRDWGPGLLPDRAWRATVAVLLAVTGLGVALAGVRHFRRARTTVNPLRPEEATQMVTSGIYRFSRNPMYLGLLLVLAGCAVWCDSAASLLVLPLYVAYLTRFQIIPEERALAARFPQGYAEYRREVRRWL